MTRSSGNLVAGREDLGYTAWVEVGAHSQHRTPQGEAAWVRPGGDVGSEDVETPEQGSSVAGGSQL